MKKHILHWKTVFIISILFLIVLLFQVLKSDFMALPDSGFSRGIQLDTIKIASGYNSYIQEHFTTAVNKDRLYLIASSTDGLQVKVFDNEAQLLDSFSLPDYKGFTKIKADFIGNDLVLNTFTASSSEFLSLKIDLDSKTASEEKRAIIEEHRALELAPTFILYGTEEALKLTTLSHSFELAQPKYLETLAYTFDSEDNSLWVAYTEFIDAQYQLNVKHLSKDYQVLADYKALYSYNTSGSDKPSELAIHVKGEELQILSVLKNQKAGVNAAYLIKLPKDKSAEASVKIFNAYNYALQPQFYDFDMGTQLIISSKTSIGKVEIGANGSFENLILLAPDLESAKSLTKNTTPSLLPEVNPIGDFNYLCYVQINQGIGRIYLSSDKPSLVEKSKHSSFSENMNILMTTLTTFLPLSYIGLIAEAYVLTPVMVVIVLLSMFFLTWAERNSTKLLLAAIALHMLAKNFFIYKHIVQSPDVFNNFPGFLNSPIKLFIWGFAMSASALYCLWDYRTRHNNAHYLLQYFVFNLIDLTLFTMLFTPYYLLI